jgi:hypothetical protein
LSGLIAAMSAGILPAFMSAGFQPACAGQGITVGPAGKMPAEKNAALESGAH